jgi:hypothetical protein
MEITLYKNTDMHHRPASYSSNQKIDCSCSPRTRLDGQPVVASGYVLVMHATVHPTASHPLSQPDIFFQGEQVSRNGNKSVAHTRTSNQTTSLQNHHQIPSS